MPEEQPVSAKETRKLAAIMFTDMVGFSRQMGVDEPRTLRLLEVHNRVICQAVAVQQGVVIKTIGDAFLVDFPSVVNAVHCAQQIQAQLRAHNIDKATDEQIHIRIGIHLGDVVQKDGDVFGDGVNIAARLQALAEVDTICISDMVYRDVSKKLDLGTVVSLGKPKLKNIAERFLVYALLAEAPQGIGQTLQVHRLKFSRRVRPAHSAVAMGLVLLLGGLWAGRYLSSSLLSTQDSALRTEEAKPPPLPDKPSIVIRPFVNLSPESGQDHFSKGLAFDLTADLSKVSSLFVIASGTAASLAPDEPLAQVGQKLGVRHVLDGSVRRAGEQVRITVQLSDAVEGHLVWSERYDGPLKDIFALQDEIRQKIVLALKVKLTPEEQERFRRAPTNNLEAYDYYLRGWGSMFLTKEANAQARQMCERAIELDPQYAAAYARSGLTYWIEWFWYGGQDQTLERAFELAQKAVALDESLPVAHLILGWVYLMKKQYDQAQTEMERAITLDPNFDGGYQALSFVLMSIGKPQEAITAATKAVRLNPQQLITVNALGQAYIFAGQYEEASTIFKKILAHSPDFWAAHWGLAIIYSELGRAAEAKVEGAEILRITPNFSVERWKQRNFLKDQAIVERHAAALRKAGLK
jgi:adenylate cyclase